MTQSANNIKNSWSLIAFARKFGPKIQIAHLSNKTTGDAFKCVAFGESENLTFVAFSRKLGELTPREIASQKDNLQVVQCQTEEGRDMYALCKKGESSWEEVDLGI